MRRIFDPVGSDRDTTRQLCGLRQGKDSVSDYAIRFRTLAAESDWDSRALQDTFFRGLNNSFLERLLPVDLPSNLDSLISLAIRTDNRLEEIKFLQQERVPSDIRPRRHGIPREYHPWAESNQHRHHSPKNPWKWDGPDFPRRSVNDA